MRAHRTNDRQLARYMVAGLVFLVVFGGMSLARDRPSKEISDRWNLRLAIGGVDTTTDIAAGDTLGILIRIEDVLDFDEQSSLLALEGFYRFNPKGKGKHRIWFSYGSVERDSSGNLTFEVPIFDETFNGSFASEYNTGLFQLQYRLSLFKTDKGEAGIIAGLSTFDYEFKLSGEISGGGGGGVTSESADFLAPIPTFGIFVTYAIRHNLLFTSSVDSLDIDIGDLEGRIFNTKGSLTWYLVKGFGIGVMIGSSDVSVTDAGQPGFKVDYQINQAGFLLTGVF